MSEPVNLRRPGQCCGVCLHLKPTGVTGQFNEYVCGAITDRNGNANTMPVIPEAGTHCRYFRARPPSSPAKERT